METCNAIKKKQSLGRRKIEMKKIEKKTSLQVTFTKRRCGLFKKAGELVALCGSDVAVIVQSPAKKFFTFGSPSVESVLQRYESGINCMTCNYGNVSEAFDHIIARNQYANSMRELEDEKKMRKDDAEIPPGPCPEELWWDRPIEGMEVREVEEYLECLELLRKNVLVRVEELEKMGSHDNVIMSPLQGDDQIPNPTLKWKEAGEESESMEMNEDGFLSFLDDSSNWELFGGINVDGTKGISCVDDIWAWVNDISP